jgi:LSU ribosomal protein L23P
MIVKAPFITEKVTNMIDANNTMEFLVDIRYTKPDIKRALESLYEIEVVKVRTMITTTGEKKAIVKLAGDDSANELASRLGLL